MLKRLVLPLALLLALGAAPTIAKTKADAATDASCSGVAVPYAGQSWCVDPTLGPLQGVVTKRTLTQGGVVTEGIYFVNDSGGWHAGGAFIDDGSDPDLKDADLSSELKLVVAQ